MNIFSFFRGPKPLRGRISNKISGIYIELPVGWEAYEIDSNTFLMGEKGNERGSLIFSVTHHVMVEKGELTNPFTGEKIDVTPVQQGEFETYDMLLAKDMHARVWQTDTDRYFIRFMYIVTKKDMELETTAVRNIISSLVKHSVEENPPA